MLRHFDRLRGGGTSVAQLMLTQIGDRGVMMIAQRKILVVDDDAMLREMLTVMLEQANYEVIVASDGVSGVEISNSGRPDLVIIDGLMPKMHGFLACKLIKQLEHAPKVILLSGVYTKPRYKLEAKYEYHADEFLTKPFMPADLLACVAKHLASLPQLGPELQPRLASTETLERHKTTPFEVKGPARPARPAGYSANWKANTPLKGEPVSTNR
jgi:DNA-binding response OmpR family regulator